MSDHQASVPQGSRHNWMESHVFARVDFLAWPGCCHLEPAFYPAEGWWGQVGTHSAAFLIKYPPSWLLRTQNSSHSDSERAQLELQELISKCRNAMGLFQKNFYDSIASRDSISCPVTCNYADLTYPESQVIIELLADWPPGGQVLVVGAGLCLLGLLLLPLLHGGLVSLLVVRDGLDNVLPAPGYRHVVALHLTIQIIIMSSCPPVSLLTSLLSSIFCVDRPSSLGRLYMLGFFFFPLKIENKVMDLSRKLASFIWEQEGIVCFF